MPQVAAGAAIAQSSEASSCASELATLPIDPSGRTIFDIGVRSHDDVLEVLIPRRSTLPASGRLLLTTSSHRQPALDIQLLCGLRFQVPHSLRRAGPARQLCEKTSLQDSPLVTRP